MGDKATDQELARFLVRHIDDPCVDHKTGLNIREFYISEAKRVIETFKDPAAKRMLEESIHKYSIK